MNYLLFIIVTVLTNIDELQHSSHYFLFYLCTLNSHCCHVELVPTATRCVSISEICYWSQNVKIVGSILALGL